MKSIWIKLLAASLLVGGLALGAQKQDSVERQLKAARNTELVDGNLKAAIEQYKKVAQSGVRPLEAQALLYMAEAYQKLGDEESKKVYERIVQAYSDQKEVVSAARAHLTKAGALTANGDRPVWTGSDVDGFGTISPDGRFLTYVDWTRTGALMLRDLANGTDRQITSESRLTGSRGGAQYSAISRDGKQIAYEWYSADQPSDLRLTSMPGAGPAEHRVLLQSKEISSASPRDWSPDGKWIAVRLMRNDRSIQLGLVSLPQGTLRVLKTTGWNDRNGKISFSPDSRYIAYSVSRDEGADVFVMSVDGSRETAAVVHPSTNEIMGWSPDGKYLLFASNRSGSFGLWALPVLDGKPQGAPMLVRSDIGSSWSLGVSNSGALYTWKTTGAPYVQVSAIDLAAGKLVGPPTGISQRFIESRGRPSWSRDGKQLAFSSCGLLGGGPCSLLVQSIETGRVHELKNRMQYFTFVSWAPNGREVLLTGTDLNARQGIYRMNVETGEVSMIVENPNNRRVWPQFSPDGKSIYYKVNGPKDLVIMERNLASGEEREFLRMPAEGAATFSLSPDRSLIAFTTRDGPASGLLVVPASGGSARRLLSETAPQGVNAQGYLNWTADGRAVLVVRSSSNGAPAELWEVPVDGRVPRKLEVDTSTWTLEGVTLSPGGKHLAFVASAAKSGWEIWALENFLPNGKTKN